MKFKPILAFVTLSSMNIWFAGAISISFVADQAGRSLRITCTNYKKILKYGRIFKRILLTVLCMITEWKAKVKVSTFGTFQSLNVTLAVTLSGRITSIGFGSIGMTIAVIYNKKSIIKCHKIK